MATELRRIDSGREREGIAVGGKGEVPRHPAPIEFEIRAPLQRLGIGKVADRVHAVDGDTGQRIGDDGAVQPAGPCPRAAQRQRKKRLQQERDG